MKFDAVSYVMSEEDFTALKQKIAELETKVTEFAIEMHIDNKRSMGILGDRSLPFTEHTFMLANERKELVPQYVNMEEFKKDLDLYKKCKELLKMLEIVHERVLDTYIGAGSDAFGAARKIYNYVKGLVKVNMPGASVIYDELKKRYKKIKEKEESSNNTDSKAEKKETVTSVTEEK
jgi:hypothetical protein